MKYKILIVVLLLIIVYSIFINKQHVNSHESQHAIVFYMISEGETLWSIASKLYNSHTGRNVYDIRKLNPGLDPGKLQIGQVIKVYKY